MKRCFISLDFSIGVIKEITTIQETIRANDLLNGKFTEPKNIHLTLKFLGEIDEEKAEKARALLSTVKFEPFNAIINDIGVFNKKHVRIIWLKLANKPVLELQKKIDHALKGLFEPEQRFMGHVTIARVKQVKNKDKLLKLIKDMHIEPMKFQVHGFTLKESILRQEGPTFHMIEEYK